MSSYKSIDLFGSGPHRMIEGPCGRQTIPRIARSFAPGTEIVGEQELAVTVTGRLVGDSDSKIWSFVDAIKAQLDAWATPGTLVDDQGHEWTNINFVRFEPGDRLDRGRVVSLEYVGRFIRLT